jgi:hypothetical protein
MPHDKKTVERLINAYEEYISLLTDELHELAELASVHGWNSSRYELGNEMRKKIINLKEVVAGEIRRKEKKP